MTRHAEKIRSSPGWKSGTWIWGCAWLILGVYAAGQTSLISRYTAVPYFDQQNYIQKTYSLAEQWRDARSWGERFNPARYLIAEPPSRPPLMMVIPAILWGRHATPHQMAYTWLAERLACLMFGVWLLSRVVSDKRWVPAALAVILGAGYFWNVDPNLYQMDLPFACAALLAVALVARAMRLHTVGGYAIAACGTIGLFLVKPQGLIYMFPFVAMASLEGIVYEVRAVPANLVTLRHRIMVVAKWAVVVVPLFAAILYLLASPYGQAIRSQYAWGEEGYWSMALTWKYARQLVAGLLPGWVLIALAIALAAAVRNRKQKVGWNSLRRWLVAGFVVGAIFWLIFTMRLTYTIDSRIVWSIMPLFVCASMIALWRVPLFGIVSTFIAIALFVTSTGIALFGVPGATMDFFVTGAAITHQQPVPEVGEIELVRRAEKWVRTGPLATPKEKDATVIVVTSGRYLDYAGMLLASYWQNGDAGNHIAYEPWVPFGDEGFDIAREFDYRRAPWFVTRSDAPPTGSPRTLVNMHAMEFLITNSGSPIASLFQRCDSVPIHVPWDDRVPLRPDGQPRHDEAVIWHLQRTLSAREYRDSLASILPQYQSAAGKARIQEQIAKFDKFVAQRCGVNVVPQSTIDALPNVPVRDVQFENGLVLRAVRFVPQKDAKGKEDLVMEMYWQATRPITLDASRSIDLVNAAGNIVRQRLEPQDIVCGQVLAGVCWLDAARITSGERRGVTAVKIGIEDSQGKGVAIFPQTGVVLDRDNQHLSVPVPH